MVPNGELAIQTLAMPAHTNSGGDIFGGWLVSQMDLAAGIMAKRVTRGRAVTIAIHTMTFLKPVHVGNLVSCYVDLVKMGNTSLTIAVEVWTEELASEKKNKVTEGTFVFVAIDANGKSREIPK
ncbi:MAG: acyl-CoA thioesterase [Legionellaceae bacterium]|nr:acyl-CoA thioesterase [Legionellaceae bacterium]MBP9775203.1 acyl-CoA thioesterase [Legionellaceae bacterium]